MLKTKLTRTLLACLLAAVLMLSLFTVSVFAEDVVDGGTADVDATDTTADADTPADTTADTTGETDDEHDHEEEEKKGLSIADIISLALLGVAIIAVVIYCLTHKEKVGKWARGLKADFKKISWSPWTQVRKNTIVVLIVVIAVGLFIAGLDVLFQQSIRAIAKLF